MAKKIKMISIPEPCHEDWNKMTPTEKGRFCDACAKVVHDVTNFSDRKLISFLEKNDDVCMQLLPNQVDRELKKSIEISPLLSRAAIAVGVMSLIATGSVVAQENSEFNGCEEVVPLPKKRDVEEVRLQGSVLKHYEVELSGVVLDVKGNPVNEATVVFNEKHEVNTDKLGRFKTKLTLYNEDDVKVLIRRYGFYSESFEIGSKSSSDLKFQFKQYKKLKGKPMIHR